MKPSLIPDFLIVGAPKCGTTALHEYLNRHPDVFIPEEKELYFFGQDLTFLASRRTSESYSRLFERASPGQLKGDSTSTNLVSEKAAEEILAMNPEAKIIIMLRNPVEMIAALHSELVFNLNEPEQTLEKALLLEEKRKSGKHIPKTLSCPVECLFYRHMASFSSQVERYLSVFGREKVLILLLEDLKKNPELVHSQVLRFLDLPVLSLDKYEKVNRNKTNRIPGVKRFLKYMPSGVKTLSRILIPSKSMRKYLYFKLHSLNNKYVERPALQEPLRLELKEFCLPDIEKLEKLIGRDLQMWKE